MVRQVSGHTSTGWTIKNSQRICLGPRKEKNKKKVFSWGFRTLLARGHWQCTHCSANGQYWQSVRNVLGNVKCRPGQKMYSLLPCGQTNASHSDFSVRLLFSLLCIRDKNLILKIILKCISQQETWYLCQKSQDPSSGATSNKSAKCPWHTVPWFHIKPQLILILGLPKTEKHERSFSRDFETQQMTLTADKQFFLLREQVPEG